VEATRPGWDPNEKTLLLYLPRTFTTLGTLPNADRPGGLAVGNRGGDEKGRGETFRRSFDPNDRGSVEGFGHRDNGQICFEFWDWVGGRYSMDSAIRGPVADDRDRAGSGFRENAGPSSCRGEHFRTAPAGEELAGAFGGCLGSGTDGLFWRPNRGPSCPTIMNLFFFNGQRPLANNSTGEANGQARWT